MSLRIVFIVIHFIEVLLYVEYFIPSVSKISKGLSMLDCETPTIRREKRMFAFVNTLIFIASIATVIIFILLDYGKLGYNMSYWLRFVVNAGIVCVYVAVYNVLK